MIQDRIRVRAWLAVTLVGMLVAAGAGPQIVAAQGSSSAGKIDINTANEPELMTVDGIGETLAKRIVEFRDEHGPYNRIEDLLKVRGIGEKSLEKLRAHLTAGKAG
jgi:competence protein ComEA